MKFADKDLEAFWGDPASFRSRRIPADARKALFRKLQILDAACELSDLRVPPENRLESLRGDREGQHSIRVNDKWRICFTWTGDEAKEVEFRDYHK